MKALKRYRLRYYWRLIVISLLAIAGLIVISGEPAEDVDFFATFGLQALICAVCWVTTWLLYRHWGMGRVFALLSRLERARYK